MAPKTVDDFDLQLINLLILNSRASVTDLANNLRSSRRRVKNRIKRMEKEGIIDYYPTIIETMKTGYPFLAYSNIKIIPGKMTSIVKALLKLDEVTWIMELMGPYDIDIIVLCKSQEELRHFLGEKLPKIPGIISTYDRLILRHYYRGILLEPDERTQLIDEKQLKLDKIDNKILDVLKINARASYKEIGQKIGISPQVVSYRVSQLEKRGVIKVYTAHVDFTKIGFQITATLGLKIQTNRFRDVVKKIVNLPEIIWVDETTGDYDLEIYLVMKNRAQLRKFIRETLSNIEGIREIETSIVTADHSKNYT